MVEVERLIAVEVPTWQSAGERKGPRGRSFMCVHVNEGDFADWCTERGVPLDDEARAEFLLWLAFRRWALEP